MPAVERHAHFPGPRENFWIFNCRFVLNHIRAGARVALDNVQRLAVKVSGPVEPGLVVESRHIDDQSFAFPVADRLSHPGVDWRRTRILQKDIAYSARVFVIEENRAGALKDLKWVGHVRCARDAGQIALDLRIGSQPVLLVLFLPGVRLRLVGDLALHHADAGRHRPDSAKREHGRGRHRTVGSRPEGHRRSRRMHFNVVVGFVECLPDSVEIGFAVRRSRRAIGGCLSGER